MGNRIDISTVGRIFGRLSFFLLFTLLVSAAVAGSIRFTSDNGLVMIPVWIDNRVQGEFGIDTGADRLYIDSAFADDNRIDFETEGQRYNVYGIDGFSGAYETTLKWFELGDERLTDQPATVINMKRMTSGSTAVPDGLIGHDVLRQFYVTVDYANQRLDLDKYRPQFVSGKRYREIRYDSHWHLILIDVTINDTLVVPMILDYGASVTSLSKQLAGQLGMGTETWSIHRLGSMAIDGGSRVADVPIVVSDYARYREKFPQARFDGIIGATYLEHFKITVDYERDLLYIGEE